MAVDAMDIDSSPSPRKATEPERKRKHKNKDASSQSKKKRKHESSLIDDETTTHKEKSKKSKSKGKSKQKPSENVSPIPDSPYSLTTATLYLPLSPISISPTHALASLLAEHLSPLLLTYYHPLQGVVLAYSNASISSTPPTSSSTSSDPEDPNPQPLTLAKTADEYGVLYVYLTATFLVFRPQRGQILEGWVNVQSEGFLGAVVLNLFSVGIERKRLPSDWKWVPPGDEEEGTSDGEIHKKNGAISATEDDDSEPSLNFDPEKEHFKPTTLASDANPFSETLAQDLNSAEEDDESAAVGYFQSVSDHRVRGTVRFRVVDIDVIPGTERDRGFLSIEGTMLSPEEEERLIEDERNGVLPSATPRRQWEPNTSMSGALPFRSSSAQVDTQESSVEELIETPTKKKSSKSSKSSKSKKKEKAK